MKTHLECIPCFLKQSSEATRMVTNDEKVNHKVLKKILKFFSDAPLENSPPYLSVEVHNIIREITNNADPYKKVKDESNKMAANLYPGLKEIVNKSDDPLLMSIKPVSYTHLTLPTN